MNRRFVFVAIVALVLIVALAVAVSTWASGASSPGATATPSRSASASESATPTPSATASAPSSATASAAPSEAPQSPHATTEPDPSSPPQAGIPGAVAVVTLASQDSASVVVVGGFVSGVMEDGGTCTFTVTATDTGATATVESTGAFNVDSTTCGSHEVGAPDSKQGAYSVTLRYANTQGAVTSSPVPVEGP